MPTKDDVRSILPGGKWHEVATKWVADDAAVLQWKLFEHGSGEWNDYDRRKDGEVFTQSCVWRIKPQVLRYRVALFHGNKGGYVNIAEREETAESWAKHPDFIRWLGDWQEAEL